MKKACPLLMIVMIILYSSAAFAQRMAVNVPMANVRSGPGTNYKILWKLEKNHPVKIIKKTGSWCYFSDYEGDKGWIYEKILTKDQAVIAVKDKCNVRSGPGTTFDIIFTLEKGVPLKVIEEKDKWLKIRHADGDHGWIHKMLVW